MLSLLVKISPLLRLQKKSRLSQKKATKVKWFGISLVFMKQIEHYNNMYMVAWRYEISLLVLKTISRVSTAEGFYRINKI